MKYSRYFIYIFLVLALSSCAGLKKSKKDKTASANLTAAQKSGLRDSLIYIPKVKVDEKTGAIKKYTPRPNPYLKIKKQLAAPAVGQFIAAKRDIELKRYKSAESILTGLTKEYKNLSGPWYLLGEIGMEKNELDKAAENFKRAIKINRRNINAHLRLALVYRKQGKYKASQSAYVDLLAVWPDFPEAHLNLGILYDIYLNKALEGQRHYEAYHFLTQGRNKRVGSG